MATKEATHNSAVKTTLLDGDLENKGSVNLVSIDALALLKIVKHCRESFPTSTSGQILGLDINNQLEVTNMFPFPSEVTNFNLLQYRSEMIANFREINLDSACVGWYLSSKLNTFLDANFIDAQISYQKKLGQQCIVLVFDLSHSTMGTLSLKAYRLNETFVDMYTNRNFKASALAANKLKYSDILVDIPIEVHRSKLASVLLSQLDLSLNLEQKPDITKDTFHFSSDSHITTLSPNYANLELNVEPFVERNLEAMLEGFEDLNNDMNNFAYYQRTLARDKTKVAAYLQARANENEVLKQKGKPLLPLESEQEIAAKFKTVPELDRVDHLFTFHQLDTLATNVNQFVTPTMTKMFAGKALQGLKDN